MQISLSVFGDEQISRDLLRFGENAMDMTDAFQSLATDFYAMEARQFATQGGFGSGGWAPLAPSTRAKKGTGSRILVDSGALKGSLTGPGSGSIRKITPDEMEVGTSISYAQYHQHGTSRMPMRKPVELRAVDKVRWVKVLQGHIIGGESNKGFWGFLTGLSGLLGGL